MPNLLPPGLRLLDEILALLLAPRCAVCARPCGPRSLCTECATKLARSVAGPLCHHCGDALSQPMMNCGECIDRASSLTRVRSLLWLDDEAKAIVHKAKYGGRFEMLGLFRTAFETQFDIFFPPEATVIPVPLHFDRFMRRGFNQAEILSRWIEVSVGARVATHGLAKIRATAVQSTLKKTDRQKNLRNAFKWVSREPPPEHVLLVDDVYTTGSTLEACAKALKKAGAKQVCAWTLLRTAK